MVHLQPLPVDVYDTWHPRGFTVQFYGKTCSWLKKRGGTILKIVGIVYRFYLAKNVVDTRYRRPTAFLFVRLHICLFLSASVFE